MRRIPLILFLVILTTLAVAQDNYDASLISKDLLPYASAVVRNEEVTIEVKDLDNVIYHVKRAVTVLNKNGDEDARITVEHDKTTLIRYIKGAIYDEYGKQTSKFSESDFEDVSVVSDFSLFEDYREKHYMPAVNNYPYTIEYEYEVRSKQSLAFIPPSAVALNTWEPNPEAGLAVEKSKFTFICNPDFNIRYKEVNVPDKVITGRNKEGQKTHSWQMTNMKAIRNEPFSPYSQTYLSSVKITPERFSYFGISGAFTNWQELGRWIYEKLLVNRQDLPTETVDHIKDITKDITDPKSKAKKIYEYMQGKTHYINITLGIGGNQPFLASDVDKQNYGDCKALVNYTQALLKIANIDSYYCIVQAGSDDKVSLLSDFASMDQGNHIILCIPFKNDTTWAECTNQTEPFGFLGDFTDDRTVLACTPEGGKLMHTPKYTTEENLEKRKANFVINEAGELNGEMETVFKGADYDDREEVIDDAQSDRIKDIKKIYPINNLEISNLEMKQDKSLQPATFENIKLSASEYGSVNDGKLYFSINSVDRVTNPPRLVRNRINPVEINRGYTNEDEITYTIPKGYHIESDLLNVSVDKPFGNFSATMALNGGKLIYKRKLQVKDGTYSKDIYPDLVDLYQTAKDADGYNVVLAKN